MFKKLLEKLRCALTPEGFSFYNMLVCSSYGFLGVNFLIGAALIKSTYPPVFAPLIFVGILFLLMVPVSVYEPKAAFRGPISASLVCFVYFILSIALSFFTVSAVIPIVMIIEIAAAACAGWLLRPYFDD